MWIAARSAGFAVSNPGKLFHFERVIPCEPPRAVRVPLLTSPGGREGRTT
jgi:hypothetical protein